MSPRNQTDCQDSSSRQQKRSGPIHRGLPIVLERGAAKPWRYLARRRQQDSLTWVWLAALESCGVLCVEQCSPDAGGRRRLEGLDSARASAFGGSCGHAVPRPPVLRLTQACPQEFRIGRSLETRQAWRAYGLHEQGRPEHAKMNGTSLKLTSELALAVLWLTTMAPWALPQDSERLKRPRNVVVAGTPRVRTSLDSEEVESLRRAALKGEIRAQRVLGTAYQEGRVLPKDDAQAASWYRKAGEQGDARGQWLLGALFDAGLGVAEDPSEAARWYRKAAEQGLSSAQLTLGTMYQRGRGVPRNDAEAVKWFREAAYQGNRGGQNALGMMYGRGLGTAQDLVRAFAWHDVAAERGSQAAERFRDRLQARMTAEQIAEARELSAELVKRMSQSK